VHNLLLLLRHDFLVQNSIFHMIKANIQLLLLTMISIAFLYDGSANLTEHVLIFLVVSIPIATITYARPMIKVDVTDGAMDSMILASGIWRIIMCKFLFLAIRLSPFSYHYR